LARFYAYENFPLPVVEFLRAYGHDVLTAKEAGNANLQIPDEDVLAFAVSEKRVVLTRNRRHFIRLHLLSQNYAGIVACTEDSDFERVADSINEAIAAEEILLGKLIRVTRPSR
jgi:uncharacterized protein with PIN domain